MGQHSLDLLEDFLVLEEILLNGSRRTASYTGAATFAEHLVNACFLRVLEKRDRVIRTKWNTALTAAALFFHHKRGVRLKFHKLGVNQCHGFGGGGSRLGDRLRNVLRALTGARNVDALGEGADRGKLGMALQEPALGEHN